MNRWCPGLNGPCDDDSRTNSHGLDNSAGKRRARIEYKRTGERALSVGQDRHLAAELRSVRADWKAIIVLVTDDGQTSESDSVHFRWKTNSAEDMPWREADECSVGELGKRIAGFVWPAEAAVAA